MPLIDATLATISYDRVGNRPGRWGPRAGKLRPKSDARLAQPRHVANQSFKVVRSHHPAPNGSSSFLPGCLTRHSYPDNAMVTFGRQSHQRKAANEMHCRLVSSIMGPTTGCEVCLLKLVTFVCRTEADCRLRAQDTPSSVASVDHESSITRISPSSKRCQRCADICRCSTQDAALNNSAFTSRLLSACQATTLGVP